MLYTPRLSTGERLRIERPIFTPDFCHQRAPGYKGIVSDSRDGKTIQGIRRAMWSTALLLRCRSSGD